jgi:uncharacterized membrane protein
MERLARVNRTVVFLVAAAYVVAALLIPGIAGAAMLIVLGVALAILMARTWPVQTPRTRAGRLVILALLIIVAVVKVTR